MQKSTRGEMKIFTGGPEYCIEGKVIYDKKGAVSAKNSRWKRDHVKLRIYHCPTCNKWHLTKKL